jgi:hypothetical protein
MLAVDEGGGVPDGMTIDSDGEPESACTSVGCWMLCIVLLSHPKLSLLGRLFECNGSFKSISNERISTCLS